MTTTEQRLADALRTIDEYCQTGLNSSVYSHWSAALEDVMRISREAIAAYDAQASRLPTEYRVTTEWDSFEELTPREAASEVWEKIKRSEGPIFTVYGRDGSVTDVDLSEDDYNA